MCACVRASVDVELKDNTYARQVYNTCLTFDDKLVQVCISLKCLRSFEELDLL